MKNNYFLSVLAILLFGSMSSSVQAQYVSTLTINNVNASFASFGNHFWDFQGTSSYEVPKGSTKTTILTSVPWIGGLDSSGNLHLAAEMYRSNGADYYSGPVRDTSIQTQAQDSIWDFVWLIYKSEIEYHKLHFTDPNYIPINAIAKWPAMGDLSLGQSKYLAPFIDFNNDGIYNPMDGDYPKIRGDQTAFFIFNDSRSGHNDSGGQPMGVEFHVTAYAFDCPNDSALNNTIFIHYDIYNRSVKSYHDVYLGIFTDFDLGYAYDDYVGCDSARNSFYAFNGTAIDGLGQPSHYGANPPAQGVTFLSDTLNSFMIFSTGGNPATMNPVTDTNYYNYMKAIWRDGSHLIFGGNGHPISGANGPNTNYMYPGSSGNAIPGSSGLVFWTEVVAGNVPGDRRGVGSIGPFNLDIAAMKSVDLAYVYARDHFGSVGILQRHIDIIQSHYDNDTTPCGGSFTAINKAAVKQNTLSLFPVPTQEVLNIDYLPYSSHASYEIYNLSGQLLMSDQLAKQKTRRVEISDFKAGLYFIIVRDDDQLHAKKFIVQ